MKDLPGDKDVEENFLLDLHEENIFQFLTEYQEQDVDEELAVIQRCRAKLPARKSKNKMKNLLKNEYVGENSWSYFSEDIIFEILTKVPARYLHEKFRYICKAWHNLISSRDFIVQNTLQNKCELLILVPYSTLTYETPVYKVKLLEMDDKALGFTLKNVPLRRMGVIRSSCNGLILMNDPVENGVLHVMNMLTKSSVTLPKCPSCCPHEECGAAIGFDPCGKEYKVVHMYADGFGFEIFTLGCSDNAWKRIPGPFKTSYERPFCIETFKWSDPVSVNELVFHWYVKSDEYIISMDVSDEKPRRTYLPEHHKGNKYRYDLLDMGGKLGLLYNVSDTQIDVWILEDFCKQNWIKRHSIEAESINYTTKRMPDFTKLFAVAALRDGEVVVFKHQNYKYTSDYSYLYDIKQRELKKFNTKIKNGSKFVPHRSSLVCWKNEPLAKALSSQSSV